MTFRSLTAAPCNHSKKEKPPTNSSLSYVMQKKIISLHSLTIRVMLLLLTERESSRKPATRPAELELELLAAALLEHKGVTTTAAAAAEGAALLEGVLLLVRVGVVAAVEPRPQLRVAQHLVRLVDARHLLLRLVLAQALLRRLVRVVQLGQLAVGRLDLPLVGVVRDPEHLVVVLGLAALEGYLRLLHQGADHVVPVGSELRSLLESCDTLFELFSIQMRFALM